MKITASRDAGGTQGTSNSHLSSCLIGPHRLCNRHTAALNTQRLADINSVSLWCMQLNGTPRPCHLPQQAPAFCTRLADEGKLGGCGVAPESKAQWACSAANRSRRSRQSAQALCLGSAVMVHENRLDAREHPSLSFARVSFAADLWLPNIAWRHLQRWPLQRVLR